MAIKKIDCSACERLLHIICLHVVDLDSESGQGGQVLDFNRESECLVELVSVKSARVKLWTPLCVRQDQLNLNINLEAKIIKSVVKRHLSGGALSSLKVGV